MVYVRRTLVLDYTIAAMMIFKVTAGLNMWKYCILHFVSARFPKVFDQWLSNSNKHRQNHGHIKFWL